MSFQIFLHGRILGTEQFLRSAANDLEGRAQWVSLLSEEMPRALLSELGLSPMLLGQSGGDQFLLLIPAEFRARAEEFCAQASTNASQKSGGSIRIVWAITENLGDWSDVRRRIQDELQRKIGAPAADSGVQAFEPGLAQQTEDFSKFSAPEDAPLTRHLALNDQDTAPAGLRTLASRAKGRRAWGVLRGSVDGLSARLHKAMTVEDHLATSEMFKRFFAGEIGVLCSLPDFWRKVSVLYAGPSGFAIYGAWDGLIGFARELQRVFQMFIETNLRDQAGTEGKSISMAIALAHTNDQPLAEVFAEAGDLLEVAKATNRDSVYLFNRVLEWKQLADAAETKQVLTRLIKEFRCSPELLNEIASFYRESDAQWGIPGRSRNERVDRPWRFHSRINIVLGTVRDTKRNSELQKLRAELVADFTGRRAAQVRLRPQGRVALEWTRLETGG